MKVRVTQDCIGCALCANLCSQVFWMTPEQRAAAPDVVDPAHRGYVEEAAESCPAHAIQFQG